MYSKGVLLSLLAFFSLNSSPIRAYFIEWGTQGSGFVVGTIIANKIYQKLSNLRDERENQNIFTPTRNSQSIKKASPTFWYYLTLLTGGLCGTYLSSYMVKYRSTLSSFPNNKQDQYNSAQEVLNYFNNVTDEKLRDKTYKKAALVFHPDKHDKDDTKFKILQDILVVFKDVDTIPYAITLINDPSSRRELLNFIWYNKLEKLEKDGQLSVEKDSEKKMDFSEKFIELSTWFRATMEALRSIDVSLKKNEPIPSPSHQLLLMN